MAKSKGKAKEETADKFYPRPFRADLPTVTFIVTGTVQPTGKAIIKYLHREFGIDDADKVFPTTGNVATDEKAEYVFGRNVHRLRTIKEVQDAAGCDAKTARKYL